MSDASPPILRLAELWGRQPHNSISSGRSGVSAALWQFEAGVVHDVSGDSDPEINIISVPFEGRSSTIYFADGRERYRADLSPAEINIVRAGEQPRALLQSPEEFAYVHLFVPQRLLRDLAEQAPVGRARDPELRDPQGESDPAVMDLARWSVAEMGAGSWLSRLALDGIALALGAHLLRRYSTLTALSFDDVPASGATLDWRLRRAIEYMEGRLAEDIGLTELSAEVGLGTTHLTSLFRAGTGEPPHRWLMRRRFERACEMLAESRLSITEIAHACGFASSQHLATVFRKRLGVTPRAWRRQRMT